MTAASSMKKPTTNIASTLRFLRRALSCAGVATVALSSAQAQTTYTWITETHTTGGTLNWSTAAKWVGGTPPVPGATPIVLDFSHLDATTSALTLRNDIAGTLNIFKWTLADAGISVVNSSLGDESQTIKFVQVGGIDPEIIHYASRPSPSHQSIAIPANITGAGTTLQFTGTAAGNSTLSVTGILSGEGGVNINKTGRILFGGANTFAGNFTLTSGEVQLFNSTAGPANNVTSGPLGTGTVVLNGGRLIAITSARTLGNSLEISGDFQAGRAANGVNKNITLTGTTLLTGSGVTRTITGQFGNTANADENTLTFSGAITDGGNGNGLTFALGTSLTKVVLEGVNTYTGDTTVNGNASNSLTLADGGSLTFVIGADGINNRILGNGTIQLDGSFIFNLSGAGSSLGDSWNIVSVATLSETFGSTFNVADFTDNLDNTWSKTSGEITYTFFENSGLLQVTAVPEPSSVLLLLSGLAMTMLFRHRRA